MVLYDALYKLDLVLSEVFIYQIDNDNSFEKSSVVIKNKRTRFYKNVLCFDIFMKAEDKYGFEIGIEKISVEIPLIERKIFSSINNAPPYEFDKYFVVPFEFSLKNKTNPKRSKYYIPPSYESWNLVISEIIKTWVQNLPKIEVEFHDDNGNIKSWKLGNKIYPLSY